MATEEHIPNARVSDLLAGRRRRRFVGRVSELDLFRTAFSSAETPFSVLYVHGPGGIGKTSLLEAFAEVAVAAEATVVRIDGRDLVPSRSGVLEVLKRHLDVPDGDDAITGPSGRLIVLLDSYEQLAALDDWWRTRLIPRLQSTALTVIAGRSPPSPGWRADPAWRDLLRVLPLRNLSREEAVCYMDKGGVNTALHGRLLEVTHGHPLGLSLLVDAVVRGAEATFDSLPPNLVGTLLRRFIDGAPSEVERRALEVCSLARVTTETLLRDALEVEDAHEVFRWLCELSFIDVGPDGVFPHDLARDVLDTDLRWRDPEGYKTTFRRVRAHIHRRLQSTLGAEQRRVLLDHKFLFRLLAGRLDWESWGQHLPEPAGAGDREAILDLVRVWEGEDSATVAEWWWDRQPEGFHVIRGRDDAVIGLVACLDLTRASPEEIARDPGAQAAWNYAQANAAPRSGEVVTQCRFVIDSRAYQGPSPTINATPIVAIQRYLGTPNLAWDFLTLAEPERWDKFFAITGLPRAPGADFELGGRRYGLFAHDFRRLPVDAWLELQTERALARDFTPPPTVQPLPVHVFSREEFDEAVRQALRDLRRPEMLGRSSLLHTRLLRDRAGDAEPDAHTLEGLLSEAVETLRQHPRDDKLLRAVDRTYVRPAATQERAAEVLGLPFSTYRRHLTIGVARIVSWLWDKEVYGTARGD